MSILSPEFVELRAKKRELESLVTDAIRAFELQYKSVLRVEDLQFNRLNMINGDSHITVKIVMQVA